MDVKLMCCHMSNEGSCDSVADFEVYDLADSNYETCVTHACSGHLGAMMGHHSSVASDAEWRWEVIRLYDGYRGIEASHNEDIIDSRVNAGVEQPSVATQMCAVEGDILGTGDQNSAPPGAV